MGVTPVATAKSVLNTVTGFHPELMTEPLPETDAGTISSRALEEIAGLSKNKTVLAVGPGISRHPQTAELVRNLIARSETAMVLDADGLNAFENRAQEITGKGRTLVITPHPGEMARLVGSGIPEVQKDRLGVARKFAHEHDLIVVLKGHRTLVVRPDGEAWVNTTGNPGMSTGGTDSRHLRRIGVRSYGISPTMASRAESKAGHVAHGPDERRPIKWMDPGATFFREVVRTLAL